MRELFATAVVSASLAAFLLAIAQDRATADPAVLAATFNPAKTAGDVSLPAYVPIKNLGVFLTSAWKTMPSAASRVETGTVDRMQSASNARLQSEASRVLPPAQSAIALVVTRTPNAPTLAFTQAIATLRASDAAAAVTPVNAPSDEVAAKPADVMPAQTLDPDGPQDVKKDPVQHVLPAPVQDAAAAALGEASAVRPPLKRVAWLTKPRSRKRGFYRDWQVGVPGQSMEPLISMCAQAPRKCSTTVEFCGC